MHIAFLYVDAGKGHITPARALSDAAIRMGHTTVVEDLFVTVKSPLIGKMSKSNWRFMLHFPQIEAIVDPTQDSRSNAKLIKYLAETTTHAKKSFLDWWYKENKPDCIVVPHFLAGSMVKPMVQQLGLPVPVFEYAADVVFTPRIGINSNLDKLYICTELGKELAIKFGQKEETISICPFPLKTELMFFQILEKQEARAKLGLKDTFTILVNLGGEGIGTTDFLEEVQSRGLPWQVITLGKLSSTTKIRYKRFKEKYPDFPLVTPGFVNNIGEYICACDVQIGKAGANALMESLYLKRPFLISNLLYAAKPTTTFFERHHVGWVEKDISKQVDIFQSYSEDETSQHAMQTALSNLPVTFGSDTFMKQILEDATKLLETTYKHLN